MKTFTIIVAMLALLGAPFALSVQNGTFGGVDVYRISPDAATVGQQSWVMLVFENTANSAANITITELLGDADFNKSAATATNTTYGTRWTYAWDISLDAGQNTSAAYWITPKSAGDYVIAPSPVVVNGVTYYLGEALIAVACNADGRCAAGEDSMNCPQDCGTASAGTNASAGSQANWSGNAANGSQTPGNGTGVPFEGQQGCAPAAALLLLATGVVAARFR